MLAPAFMDESNAPMSPCMWNRGMMFRQRSVSTKFKVRRIFSAEVQRFFAVSGTILGRDVVPDVCRTKAISWL